MGGWGQRRGRGDDARSEEPAGLGGAASVLLRTAAMCPFLSVEGKCLDRGVQVLCTVQTALAARKDLAPPAQSGGVSQDGVSPQGVAAGSGRKWPPAITPGQGHLGDVDPLSTRGCGAAGPAANPPPGPLPRSQPAALPAPGLPSLLGGPGVPASCLHAHSVLTCTPTCTLAPSLKRVHTHAHTVHIHSCTLVHTHAHSRRLSHCAHSRTHSTHSHMHTRVHTLTHAPAPPLARVHSRTRGTHAHVHTCVHTSAISHTCAHTHSTHSHMHPRAHTLTHAHSCLTPTHSHLHTSTVSHTCTLAHHSHLHTSTSLICAHPQVHTHMHAHTLSLSHVYTLTRTHLHTHVTPHIHTHVLHPCALACTLSYSQVHTRSPLPTPHARSLGRIRDSYTTRSAALREALQPPTRSCRDGSGADMEGTPGGQGCPEDGDPPRPSLLPWPLLQGFPGSHQGSQQSGEPHAVQGWPAGLSGFASCRAGSGGDPSLQRVCTGFTLPGPAAS